MKKIVLLSSVLLFSTISYAGLYRWVDDTGKVHYSDKIPAAVSKTAHSELSGNGLVKKTVDPQADKNVASEKQREKDLEERELLKQQEIKLKKQKEIDIRKKRDKYLLSTYEDKNELIHFFENKIKLIEGNSNILKAQSTVLKKKIKKLEARKNKIKNDRVQASIDKKIVRILDSIDQYKKALEENSQELIRISKNYQRDYKRFTELTQNP